MVSIIVPVYNVESFLEESVHSICAQTFSDFEVILIDDGSTDKSGYICDELALRDTRIRTLHKNNGGLASARNCGLEACRGKYLTFVDSDDLLNENYLETLVNGVITTGSELAISPLLEYTDKSEINIATSAEFDSKVLDKEELLKSLLYQTKFSTSAPGKLYKSELWDDVRFENGRLFEDVVPIYEVIKKCDKAYYTSSSLYYYFNRPGSITKSGFSERKIDYIRNCKIVLHDVKQTNPKLEKAALSRLAWAYIYIFAYMKPTDNQTLYRSLWSEFTRIRGTVIKDRNVRYFNKLLIGISYLGGAAIHFAFEVKKKIARG